MARFSRSWSSMVGASRLGTTAPSMMESGVMVSLTGSAKSSIQMVISMKGSLLMARAMVLAAMFTQMAKSMLGIGRMTSNMDLVERSYKMAQFSPDSSSTE